MSTDILERLQDLYKQATTEKSHYYTGNTLVMAINEILVTRSQLSLANEKLKIATEALERLEYIDIEKLEGSTKYIISKCLETLTQLQSADAKGE